MSGMRPQDIARLAAVGEVVIAPDGHRVAYTVTTVDPEHNRYRTRIWVADSDGGAPWPVSAGEGRDLHPAWSPDGRLLAWATRPPTGPRTLWTAPVDGPGAPSSCGRWPDEITEVAWSPDSRRIAVVVRHPDAEQYGTLDAPLTPDRMPPRRITTLLSRLNGENFVADRPAHLYLVTLDGAAPARLLTPGPWEVADAAWSPDGTRLAFSSARHDGWDLDLCRDLWTVGAQPSPHGAVDLVRLTPTDADHHHPSWSPDGTAVAYLFGPTPTEEPRHTRVGVVDVETQSRRDLTASFDRNAGPHGASRAPAWLDAGWLAFAAEEHGALRLWTVAGDGGSPPQPWVGGDRQILSWDVTAPGADRALLAFSAADPLHVPELHLAPLTGLVVSGEERRVTDLTAALTDEVDLVAPQRFVANAPDGTEIECWAMAPLLAGGGVGAGAGVAGRHPTILTIHGGPFTQYGYTLLDEFQLLVAAGFGVVYCNPRGSSGYSEAWGRAIRWPEAAADPGSGWGGVDADDVMACIEEAGRRFDWVDGDALGVQGGSYGGYLTSWLVGHTDRFRAAVSERAVNNLVTMESDSDIAGFFSSYVGYNHLDRPELFARHSPVTFVRSITTPLLLVHSEDDLRCPISQAEEMFVALRLLGKGPELVRFPAESHELSRSGSPAHRIMRAELILEWFDRHLRPAASASPEVG